MCIYYDIPTYMYKCLVVGKNNQNNIKIALI